MFCCKRSFWRYFYVRPLLCYVVLQQTTTTTTTFERNQMKGERNEIGDRVHRNFVFSQHFRLTSSTSFSITYTHVIFAAATFFSFFLVSEHVTEFTLLVIQSGGESNIMASLSIHCEFSGRSRCQKRYTWS